MKKTIKFITLISLSLLLVTGCSSNVKTQVQNQDEVIINIKDNPITKANIYKYLKLRFGPNLITSNLITMQLDAYVNLDAQDEAEGQKRLEDTKELLGDDFEDVILSSGYTDVEDYYQRVVLSKIKNDKLFNTYLEENFADVVNGLHSKKVTKLVTSSKPEAEKALAELNTEEDLSLADFIELAKSYDDEISGQTTIEHVYESREALKFLNNQLVDAQVGLVEKVLMEGDNFYLIFIEDVDLDKDKAEIIASIMEDQNVHQIVSKSMFTYYSQLGDFKIHDSELYDLYKESNPFLFD